MDILFRGFIGVSGNPGIGWFLIVLGIGLGLLAIVFVTIEMEGAGSMAVIAIILIILGFAAKADTRIPIIKATINESASWQEINNKYQLLEQTGEIYTFEVKDMDIKEWEILIEQENKK